MKKYIFISICFICSVGSFSNSYASTDSLPTYRVGIFAPLYLDSVFTAHGNFKFKQGIPKFIVPANDFVNGALVALDSMNIKNVNLEVSIFDTKSFSTPLASLLKMKKLDSLQLYIGAVKDADFKLLADAAQAKNKLFISATYPNDGGVVNNPNLIIMNSTLKAHCEAIYSYILQNNNTDKIILCRKKGQQEDKVASYFKAINEQEGKPLLNIQTLNFDSSITSEILKRKLDSNRHSTIIGASLDESFASGLAAVCNDLQHQYPLTLLGMPNWDAFKTLAKNENLLGLPIYFTTPYYNSKDDDNSKILINAYANKLKGRPTDMAFKGFECTSLFSQLLANFPGDVLKHINEKSFKIFNEYNFRPVYLKKGNKTPDYFENKHLYFIKLLNGSTYKAW